MNIKTETKPTEAPKATLPAAPTLPATEAEFVAQYDAANPHPFPGLAPLTGVVAAGGRTRTLFPGAGVIERRATENPKRYGSDTFYRFNLYRTGMTVDEYLEACGKLEGTRQQDWRHRLRDVNWDTEPHRQFIAVWPAGTTTEQIAAVRSYVTARDAAIANYKAAAALRPVSK